MLLWPPISENRGVVPLFRALVFTALLAILDGCYGREGLAAEAFLVKTNVDSVASAADEPQDLLGSDPPPIVLSLCS